MTAIAASVTRRAAEVVCRQARDVEDARMLMEMPVLLEEDGHELLPDDVQVIPRELLELEAPPGGEPQSRPVIVQEPPDPRAFVPPGLRDLPPARPAAKPQPQRRFYSLTEELEELERTDPDVAAAAASYDRMVERITGKPLPPRDSTPRPIEEGPVMPASTAPSQPRPRLEVLADDLVERGVIARDDAPAKPEIRSDVAGRPYITALSVVELFVDHTYQRPLDEARVKRMAKDWDPRMIGILEVSDRGPAAAPRYAVINGQHRWATAGRAGVQYVPCNVHEGLTVEDEARLMFELDRSTKALSSWDKWRSRKAAGDPNVLAVERVAASHGMTVTPGGFGAVGAAEALLRAGGVELLETTTSILVVRGDGGRGEGPHADRPGRAGASARRGSDAGADGAGAAEGHPGAAARAGRRVPHRGGRLPGGGDGDQHGVPVQPAAGSADRCEGRLMADYPPGSFFLARIPGPVGWLIGVGQALAGDPARYSHAGIVINAAGDVVEAEPGGARRANLSEYAGQPLLIGDPVAWVMSLMTPEQAKLYEPVGRRAVVIEACELGPQDGKRGVGYSPLDYLALALIHLEKLLTGRPRPTWRFTKFIRVRVQSSGHMICSQLVDAVMEGAGTVTVTARVAACGGCDRTWAGLELARLGAAA